MGLLTYDEFVVESPVVADKINSTYLKEFLIKPIQKALARGDFNRETDKIYSHIEHTYSLYVVANKNPEHISDVIGGVLLTSFGDVCGHKDLYQEKAVKKFIEDYPNMALDVFRLFSDGEFILMSDSLHTIKMSSIWKKWITEPEKYNIEVVDCIDISNCSKVKLEDAWGKTEKHEDYRVLLRFH